MALPPTSRLPGPKALVILHTNAGTASRLDTKRVYKPNIPLNWSCLDSGLRTGLTRRTATMAVMMCGTDKICGPMFRYVDLEKPIALRHPLRKIRQVVNDPLASLDRKSWRSASISVVHRARQNG